MKKTTYILIGLVAILGWTIYPYSVRADITSNLICWYKLNEGTGTSVTDSGGSCGTGTLSGTTPPSWTTGKIGTGAINNTVGTGGGGGYVTTSNNIFGSNQNQTYAAWVNPSDLTGQSGHNIFLSGDVFNHWLEVDSSGHFNYHDFNNNDHTYTGQTLTTGNWYHLAVTCDWNGGGSPTMTMYINGSQVKQDSGAGTSCGQNSAQKYGFAGLLNNVGSYGFTGKIDEVRIYTRVLTSTDVSDLYAYTEGGGGATAVITTSDLMDFDL